LQHPRGSACKHERGDDGEHARRQNANDKCYEVARIQPCRVIADNQRADTVQGRREGRDAHRQAGDQHLERHQ
jgi:hypothetical protein